MVKLGILFGLRSSCLPESVDETAGAEDRLIEVQENVDYNIIDGVTWAWVQLVPSGRPSPGSIQSYTPIRSPSAASSSSIVHLKQHEREINNYMDDQIQELEVRITGKLTQLSIAINRVADIVEEQRTETRNHTTEVNTLNSQLAKFLKASGFGGESDSEIERPPPDGIVGRSRNPEGRKGKVNTD